MTSVPAKTSSGALDVTPAAPGRLTVLHVRETDGDAPRRAAAHRAEVLRSVAEHGAVLLRGLGLKSPAAMADTAVALGIEPMVERERFSPRREYQRAVYSSSEWPSDEPICMHHELSYAAEVPAFALFGALAVPREGGATAVADSQEVLYALPDDLVARFTRLGWQLTRTYREVGVAWSEAFGTDDPQDVDAYCRHALIDHEWLPDGALRTRQRRAAVLSHPGNGRPVWFNQAAFLNELTLDPMVRAYLTDVYGPDSLPFHTTYGDGTPIPAAAVDVINEAYRAATRSEPWQVGDLLLVDNVRMAHSREAYEGDREIAVMFGNPTQLAGHVLP
ncbi:TauD/TfdA family dioxygenase [Streptomyces benahoarensis]|uniref:TauD/TfdA family dioxygenase n=1 Tax=Streptomyces benahoarensis TaxID=2595054 RepID=A0A553ZQB6_9ACTN|nr:TauD/TfdA family dioxygenase [Streptomyces benahoarensis]TSB31516.1 TauD/TfdA family dioxygenase [Streptomyces benahoarensis]TSB43660.1 TauD/TfdA family dioxygenase [Streptomyces benahoarensis]